MTEEKGLPPAEDFKAQPLMEHLGDLLKHTRMAFLWVVVGAAIGYIYSKDIVFLLQQPLLELLPSDGMGAIVYTKPFEKLWTYLRVSIIAGVFCVSPLIFWEVAAFVGPGLKKNEKSKILYLMLWIVLCCVGGILLGYNIALPAVLKAIFNFGGGAELPFLSVSSYINTALGILVVCSLFIFFPVMMIHFSLWGWVRSELWRKGRRIALVVNAALSAMLSPPDILSMFVVLIPLQCLYELGILGAAVAQWASRDGKKSKESLEPPKS